MVHFIFDIMLDLESDGANKGNQAELGSNKENRCDVHKQEKLSVYCLTCTKSICHQCALFGGMHNSHQFKPIDEIYETHKEEILEQVKLIKKRHADLLTSTQEMERNIEMVKNAKEEKVNFHHHIFHSSVLFIYDINNLNTGSGDSQLS